MLLCESQIKKVDMHLFYVMQENVAGSHEYMQAVLAFSDQKMHVMKCMSCPNELGPVPERPISANPGLKFWSVFVFYFLMYYLE